MALAIDLTRIPAVRRLSDWLGALSLRARIAGTMLALVAFAGVALAAWAVLADDRLKRNITYDLLSEELAHYEQRMRLDRGAEPLRSARLSIYRSSDFAELPRRIATLKPGEMHRVRSAGRVLDVLVQRRDLGEVAEQQRADEPVAGEDELAVAALARVEREDLVLPRARVGPAGAEEVDAHDLQRRRRDRAVERRGPSREGIGRHAGPLQAPAPVRRRGRPMPRWAAALSAAIIASKRSACDTLS